MRYDRWRNHLIILLSIWCLGDKEETLVPVLLRLMLNGNLAKVDKKVLNLGVSTASLDTAEVVEPLKLVEEIVDDSNDDGDTDGVAPDDNNGNDASVTIVREKLVVVSRVRWLTKMASEPAEDGE